jgi:hypothetical protein
VGFPKTRKAAFQNLLILLFIDYSISNISHALTRSNSTLGGYLIFESF